MKTTQAAARVRAFTMIEILLVITIIVILASLIVPAANYFIQKALLVRCRNNLQEIGKALTSYSNDYFLQIPPALTSLSDQSGEGGEGEGGGETTTLTPTNALWIPLQERVGLGVLWDKDHPGTETDYIGNPLAMFCPAAEELSEKGDRGLQNWGSDEAVVECSYLYRGNAAGASADLEDDIREGRALVIDYNLEKSDTLANLNHNGARVNVLFANGTVEEFENRSSEFSCVEEVPAEFEKVFTNADARMRGPEEAPQETPTQ